MKRFYIFFSLIHYYFLFNPLTVVSAFLQAKTQTSGLNNNYEYSGTWFNEKILTFTRCQATKNNDSDSITTTTTKESMNPITKASWYAAEMFGKAFAQTKISNIDNQDSLAINKSEPPKSLQETLERIKRDFDQSYFVSGQMDTLIYDKQCVFADPFVSFAGRDRFVENLSNLGSFVTKYDIKLLEYSPQEEGSAEKGGEFTVLTKVMVKLELGLPWKPILAWPWGVRYVIDTDTNLITQHVESWDIEPWEGVKQVFRKPTTTI